MKTSTLGLLGSSAVVIAVIAAIYLRPLPDAQQADATQSEAVDEAAEQEVAVVAAPELVPEVEVEPSPEEEEPDVAAVDETDTAEPVLTEFRFEPDGAVLVSGRTDSGVSLAILINGDEIDRLEAGPDGTFFYVGLLGYSDSARVLSVVADPDGANLPADRTFVMAANPEPIEVAIAEPEAEATPTSESEIEPDSTDIDVDIAGSESEIANNDIDVADVATDTANIDADVAEQNDNAASSTTILSVTGEGVDVVQAPVADESPEVMSTVALDAITYDPDGEVVLQGRALGEGFVQVYVDNTPISRLPVNSDGSWRGDLPDVDTGVYTLRIDELDAGGEVVSRIETPFLREDPETVAEALADEVSDPEFSIATRTVQPGATLWAIAEERYGDGVLFVTVFEANKDRIRNPNLIYPGQVFVLPGADE